MDWVRLSFGYSIFGPVSNPIANHIKLIIESVAQAVSVVKVGGHNISSSSSDMGLYLEYIDGFFLPNYKHEPLLALLLPAK